MAADKSAVFAAYRKKKRAEQTKNLLVDSGFLSDAICIFTPAPEGTKDFHQRLRMNSRIGAMAGAIIGGSVVLLVGIALNLNIISFPGQFGADMPIGARILFFIAAIALGACAGGGIGLLVGNGTPEPASSRFATYTQVGGTILSVSIDNANEAQKAHIILERSEGQDITEMNENEGWKMIHEQIYERSTAYEPKLLDNQDV